MCSSCSGIILREEFYSPGDYLNCLEYIAELPASGGFEMLEQTCVIEEVKNADGFWYDDVICHRIACRQCGDSFVAQVDTYHDGGGFTRMVGGR